MPAQALFGISVAFGFIAWGIVAARYFWPALRGQSRVHALRPLLILHGFRFIGLAFLVPGVVSPELSRPIFTAWSDWHRLSDHVSCNPEERRNNR
jgi:hypothetical protein